MSGVRSRSLSNLKSKQINERHILSLTLDQSDKKTPEFMLKRLTDKINELETNEILNLEK